MVRELCRLCGVASGARGRVTPPAASRVARVCALLNAANAHYLIESKRTGRTQDLADIEVLEAIRARRGEE